MVRTNFDRAQFHLTDLPSELPAGLIDEGETPEQAAIRELEEEVKKAGIVVMNEIGLDPGIDHLYAIKTIDEVHAKGGKVRPVPYLGGIAVVHISI